MEINYSSQEKKDILISLGYQLKNEKRNEWKQWGPHDNQGDYLEINRLVFYKNGLQVSIDFLSDETNINNIFNTELNKKLKSSIKW